MPHDDSAGVAPGSASDGVGVAERAAAFLGGEGRAGGPRSQLPDQRFLHEQRLLLCAHLPQKPEGMRPQA